MFFITSLLEYNCDNYAWCYTSAKTYPTIGGGGISWGTPCSWSTRSVASSRCSPIPDIDADAEFESMPYLIVKQAFAEYQEIHDPKKVETKSVLCCWERMIKIQKITTNQTAGVLRGFLRRRLLPAAEERPRRAAYCEALEKGRHHWGIHVSYQAVKD